MNTANSLELAIAPFKDGSYVVFWSVWKEVEPGIYQQKDFKTAARSSAILRDVLERVQEEACGICPGAEPVVVQVRKLPTE